MVSGGRNSAQEGRHTLDILRREKVLRLIFAQMYQQRMQREDPIGQLTPETIREELCTLARASSGKITEEEATELAGLIHAELTTELERFQAAARRAHEKLAPGRRSS